MTDHTWQSPGDAQPPRPQYGEYAPVPPSGPAPAWSPPPKPGLIPLRPLTLGDILAASFHVLRRNPRPTFGAALLLNGLVLLVSIVVVGVVVFLAFGRATSGTQADQDELLAGATGMIVVSAIIPALFSIAVTAVLQGIIALEVSRGTVGEKLTLRGLWSRAKGRIGALIGWAFLVSLALALAVLVVVGAVAAAAISGGTAGIVSAVLIGVFGGGALLVTAFWVGTRVSLASSAIMIERLSIGAAIRRSWSLTTGYFWRTLGIQLLVAVVISIVSQIISTPVGLVIGMASTLLNPNGDNVAAIVGVVVIYIVFIVVTLVFGAIAVIIQTAASALIYVDLRIRKEGLDLDLGRFVEARNTGRNAPDPYATETVTATPTPGSPWA